MTPWSHQPGGGERGQLQSWRGVTAFVAAPPHTSNRAGGGGVSAGHLRCGASAAAAPPRQLRSSPERVPLSSIRPCGGERGPRGAREAAAAAGLDGFVLHTPARGGGEARADEHISATAAVIFLLFCAAVASQLQRACAGRDGRGLSWSLGHCCGGASVHARAVVPQRRIFARLPAVAGGTAYFCHGGPLSPRRVRTSPPSLPCPSSGEDVQRQRQRQRGGHH